MAEHADDNQDLAALAEKKSSAIVGFVGYLSSNKKWWLLPVLVVMLLLGGLFLLSSSVAAPFVYTLF
jgi:hypothetical protein